MHGMKQVKGQTEKKKIPIDILLQWAYLDELSKRKTSSAEGIWDRLSQYGSLGGVNPDPGHGAAQRYPHFGLPHKDAELIEAAVSKLPSAVIDWNANFELLAGNLAPLVNINNMRAIAPPKLIAKAAVTPANDGRGITSVVARDVILVNTINVEALVFTHAIKGTKPGGWRTDTMRAVPTRAERGPLAKIIGICKGKNSYTSGSHCPLRYEPSPLKVVMARAEYFAWYQALISLTQTLNLAEHIALLPDAVPVPWADEGPPRWLIGPVRRSRVKPLPLKPSRKLAGPPKRFGRDKGRIIPKPY